MSKLRKIASHYILMPDGLSRNGLITIDSEGQIVSLDTYTSIDSCYGVEFYSGILIPGMVNAHSHLELAYMAGQIEEGCGFAGFAQGMAKVRGQISQRQKEKSISFYDTSMWNHGIAAVGDISNSSDSFDVKTKSYISYHTFVEAYGLRLSDLAMTKGILQQAHKQGLTASITPHSTYSLNERLFRQAIDEDKTSPLSLHFMESSGEQGLFRGEGEMAAWYEAADFKTDFLDKYESPTDRLISNISKDRKVMMVHNTCVDRDDVERLQKHFGDNLTWVLCPRSNKFITGSLPPVDLLRGSGGRIAIGTDSLASNHDLFLIEELKMLNGIPLDELLKWITKNGAEALGLGEQLGSFEVGKRPGVVLLEKIDLDNMCLTTQTSSRRLV